MKRVQSDPRIDVSMKASSKGWFAFRLDCESDLRDALFWLNHAYEAAKKKTPDGVCMGRTQHHRSEPKETPVRDALRRVTGLR